MHFTHVKYGAPGCSVGKAHLLHDVIDNIENIDSDYYCKRTLLCLFKQNDKLFKRIQQVKHNKSIQGGKDEDKWPPTAQLEHVSTDRLLMYI